MKTLLMMAAILFGGMMMEANAQVNANVKKRYGWQQGSANSSITPGEAARLRMQKREIHRDIRQAKRNDGKIGPMERNHIRREMNQYKRQRFMAKHNRRGRF